MIDHLAAELHNLEGICSGFVIMPDHVHAIVWFPQPERLSQFMKQWKQKSSTELKRFSRGQLTEYWQACGPKEPFWQPRFYPFNLYSEKKALEKLQYMHMNPVNAGLVKAAADWAWSSARFFEDGRAVGVPIERIF